MKNHRRHSLWFLNFLSLLLNVLLKNFTLFVLHRKINVLLTLIFQPELFNSEYRTPEKYLYTFLLFDFVFK